MMSTTTCPDLVQAPAPSALASQLEGGSVGKAMALLDAFSGQLSVVGVTVLAVRAKMPKSTAHRLLNVLVSCGYVRRVGDRYCLTEHVFEMGNQVSPCRPTGIRDIAAPYVGELFAETRQTIQLATLSGTEVLYLDKVAGRNAAPVPTSIGARRPAYATALGKVLVAYADDAAMEANLRVPFRRFTPRTLVGTAQFQRSLDRIRAERMATDLGELRLGVNCIAAPIFDSRSGKAIAAISICSSTSVVRQRYQRALARTADELSRLRFTAA